MIGIECESGEIALDTTQRLLESGFVVLPSGDRGRVLSLTPPLSIGEDALDAACDAIVACLEGEACGLGSLA